MQGNHQSKCNSQQVSVSSFARLFNNTVVCMQGIHQSKCNSQQVSVHSRCCSVVVVCLITNTVVCLQGDHQSNGQVSQVYVLFGAY